MAPDQIVARSAKQRYDHLDMLRGVAALLVLVGHLRGFLFVSYDEVNDAGWAITVFYGLTGLGHEAVIIFFALSGFLVGGKALDDMLSRRWSWVYFMTRRLTRLWIVIIPALLATLLFDWIGLSLTRGSGYDGVYRAIYASGPTATIPLDHSLGVFCGNLVFLQTIAVPVFGSNGPMWSLANEFWYYLVFPLAASVVLVRQSYRARAGTCMLLGVALVVLPTSLLEGGAVWLAGALTARLTKTPAVWPLIQHQFTRIVALGLLACVILMSRISSVNLGDMHLGLVVTLILPVMAMMPSPGYLYTITAKGLSEISYSLYLTHFPLLSVFVFGTLAPERYQPGAAAAILFVFLLCIALGWAVLFWWCFERHTDFVFRQLRIKLLSRAAAGRGGVRQAPASPT